MKELFSGVWCSDSAICCKGVMPQDVAWHYLNNSIHHLADEKLTGNQQNQKSTVFLFSKAAWRKSSMEEKQQLTLQTSKDQKFWGKLQWRTMFFL